PFLGGQATAWLLAGYGNNDTSLNANVTATANILGMTVGPFSKSITRQQDTTGFTDLIPMFTDRWNAGHVYDQLTGDDGCAPVLCPFKSRVIGVGPQIGYIFPVAGMQGYLNLKGYGEFDAANRPDGWNVWLTFVLS